MDYDPLESQMAPFNESSEVLDEVYIITYSYYIDDMLTTSRIQVYSSEKAAMYTDLLRDLMHSSMDAITVTYERNGLYVYTCAGKEMDGLLFTEPTTRIIDYTTVRYERSNNV